MFDLVSNIIASGMWLGQGKQSALIPATQASQHYENELQ